MINTQGSAMIIGGSGNDMINVSNVNGAAILGDVGFISFTSNYQQPSSICFSNITTMLSFSTLASGNDIITSLSASDPLAHADITLSIFGGDGDDRINVNTTSRYAFVCGDHCQGILSSIFPR
jgi:Ca2+-binding RTX toxin-like protein